MKTRILQHTVSSSGRDAFVLVATTVMTAVSLLLAGAMLQARSQWRSYSNQMVEKLVVEAAAEAEAQDFANRIRVQLKTGLTKSPGDADGLPTGISQDSVFGREPFRRVEIRGGVARTSEKKPPRLFETSQNVEMVGTAVGRQPNIGDTDNTLRLPVFWVPTKTGEKAPPAAVQLGIDDPYSEILSRSSFAAISAYSAPRRAFFAEGARVGFGNAVSIHARTFPVSAFTAIQFSPDGEIAYEGGGDDDQKFGRVYSGGTVRIGRGGIFERITAMKGLKSGSDSEQMDESSAQPTLSVSSEYGEGGEGGGGDDYEGGGGDDHGGGKQKPEKAEGVKFRSDKSDSKPEIDQDGDARVGVGRVEDSIKKEQRKLLRGVVVGADNGARELVRNQYADTVKELVDATSSRADCNVIFTKISADKDVPGSYETVGIATGGLKLKIGPEKAVVPSCLRIIDGGKMPEGVAGGWLDLSEVESKWSTGEDSAAFFAKANSSGTGGRIYFDPSRLRFVGGADVSSNPFSISVDLGTASGGAGQSWQLYLVTSEGIGEENAIKAQGLTVVFTDGTINLLGSFLTHGTPSMIIAPNIRVYSRAGGEKTVKIGATLVTRGASPTHCLLPGGGDLEDIEVSGGCAVWESAGSAGSFAESIVSPPEGEDGKKLLSGEIAPALAPVVSEVRVNGNAPFTRRGLAAARPSSGAGAGVP